MKVQFFMYSEFSSWLVYLRAAARCVLAALRCSQFLTMYSMLLDLQISVNLASLKLHVFRPDPFAAVFSPSGPAVFRDMLFR